MNSVEQIIEELRNLPRYNICEFDEGGGYMAAFREESSSGQWIDADDISNIIERYLGDSNG